MKKLKNTYIFENLQTVSQFFSQTKDRLVHISGKSGLPLFMRDIFLAFFYTILIIAVFLFMRGAEETVFIYNTF